MEIACLVSNVTHGHVRIGADGYVHFDVLAEGGATAIEGGIVGLRAASSTRTDKDKEERSSKL